MFNRTFQLFVTFLTLVIGCTAPNKQESTMADELPVYRLTVAGSEANANVWSVNDTTAVLLALGSEDNLFQQHPMQPQLDYAAKAQANFIKCTLSSRDVANQYPYNQQGDARYDLNDWSENYWNRIDKFLRETEDRGLVVQLEVWALLDFYAPLGAWSKNPFNPMNNLNYTSQESGLPEQVQYSVLEGEHPFFSSVPTKDNNTTLLQWQQKFVEKVLQTVRPYRHVLLCINSGGGSMPDWNAYWVGFVKQRMAKWEHPLPVGIKVNTLNLRNRALQSQSDTLWLEESLSEISRYIQTRSVAETPDFVDFSDHNFLRSAQHYRYAKRIGNLLNQAENGKSIKWHSSSIYGGQLNEAWSGGIDDAPERLWQNFMAGAVGLRFEATPMGLGNSKLAQAHLLGIRSLVEKFEGESWQNATHLLQDREDGEAFMIRSPKGNMACYFPNCATVGVPMENKDTVATVQWLDVLNGNWEAPQKQKVSNNVLTLNSPCEGKWAAIVTMPAHAP